MGDEMIARNNQVAKARVKRKRRVASLSTGRRAQVTSGRVRWGRQEGHTYDYFSLCQSFTRNFTIELMIQATFLAGVERESTSLSVKEDRKDCLSTYQR